MCELAKLSPARDGEQCSVLDAACWIVDSTGWRTVNGDRSKRPLDVYLIGHTASGESRPVPS